MGAEGLRQRLREGVSEGFPSGEVTFERYLRMKSCWPHGQRGDRNSRNRDCIAQGLEMLNWAGRKVMVCDENPTVILIGSEASSYSSDDESFLFI